MALLDSLAKLFSQICFYLHLLLLNFQLFIRQQVEYRTSPAKASSRTLLIIGDAVARGVGDSLGHCGLATRLPAMLHSRQEDTGLRLHWHVLTAGKVDSKAAHWAPGTKHEHFQNVLMRGPFKNAHIVFVVLGVHDDIINEGGAIVEAIARIAEGIVRLGKHAIVSTLPNEFAFKSSEHARVRALNADLKNTLESIKAENNRPGDGSLSFDVDMAKVYAMGNDALSIGNDFITPNATGYRLLTNELFDAFLPTAKKVEWAHWKQKLSPR